MKRLKVDWSGLEEAFDNTSWEMNYYLNLETGEVVMTTEEEVRTLERIYEDHYNPDDKEGFDLATILKEEGFQDWLQEALLMLDSIESASYSEMLPIPRAETREAYRDMERFIATVADDALERRLWRAIQGRGAFRYFKDVLYEHPSERERWFAFEDARVKERILAWLHDQGVEAIE